MEDSEKAWLRIEQEFKEKSKKIKFKVDYGCPYKNKYNELKNIYSSEYGKNTGTLECEEILKNLRAFERVFEVMKL